MYDVAQEGDYRWVDCTNVASWLLEAWAPGQPSDTMATENCVSVNSQTGQIDDRDCDMDMIYVCEVTPKGEITFLKIMNTPRMQKVVL